MRFKNRLKHCKNAILVYNYNFRYLLLELRFESEADRRKVYSTLNERSLNQEIKNSILALHGNYGLACVLHSLHGNPHVQATPLTTPISSKVPKCDNRRGSFTCTKSSL